MEEVSSVSYSTAKKEFVKESPQNWTDVSVQETMQDNRTFCHDDNNAQENIFNDSVDGNSRRRRGHEIQSLNIEDETKLSGHLKRHKETCTKIASQVRQDHSNRSRVRKRDMKNPNIKQSQQMKVTSESHLEKRRKQANKFGIPASDDVYYDKEVQEAFDERAPNLQSDESNQNLGFKRTKSINSNKESPSQPGQRNQRYRINTECDGNEGGCNGAAVKPGYCIDPAALTTEAHTLASTGIYNGAAVMPDYWFDPILATEARTLASTGEPADEITYTCIQSRHGIDKCISCNYKRVHESVQEQNHK